MKSRIILIALALFVQGSLCYAQESYSSATLSVAKRYADASYTESGGPAFPNPFQIIEEEMFNYHRHGIERPSEPGGITMSYLWGNDQLTRGADEAVLQLGIATKKLDDLSEVPPVNLSLVIDRSGSMEGDRIEKARQSALLLVDKLRSFDRVAVVVFDNGVEIAYPSQEIGDKAALKAAIKSISVGGSTDLNAGIIAGFKQAAIHCCTEFNNRVIILTDALTNTGEVDPVQIVKNAGLHNIDIGLTMIGVGIDFNVSLARSLQTSHNSSMHFINDADDMLKVFDHEVEALLAPIARNPRLEIEVPSDMKLTSFYGYDPQFAGNKITLDLENINAGLTQVFLMKFQTENVRSDRKVNARLTFYNIHSQKEESIDLTAGLDYSEHKERSYEKIVNPEVKKNYTIAFMASRYRDAAEEYYLKPGADDCYTLIEETLEIVDGVYAERRMDKDVKYVRDILATYSTKEKVDLVTTTDW